MNGFLVAVLLISIFIIVVAGVTWGWWGALVGLIIAIVVSFAPHCGGCEWG